MTIRLCDATFTAQSLFVLVRLGISGRGRATRLGGRAGETRHSLRMVARPIPTQLASGAQ